MELNLLELRRYVIDNRIEIRFSDSTNEALLDSKGLVRITSDDKTARVEDILSAAESFDVTRQGKSQRMSRQALSQAVSQAFKERGFATTHTHEED
jgi:alpha-D-ribose 1-methylphosphonate 5-triphosphate synthase subunit PhnI